MRLAIAITVATCAIARAEIYSSTLADLLARGTRVEVVQVDAVRPDVLEMHVVAAIRSTHAIGDRVVMRRDAGLDVDAVAGDRLLVACDDRCPRALGIERDGLFVLDFEQPFDDAALRPGLVEASSVAALAAGKPAPPLCLRGTFPLLDAPGAHRFEVHLDAGTGEGSGQVEGIAVASVRSWNGSLAIDTPGYDRPDFFLVTPRAPLRREQDGCYRGAFTPTRAVPRTVRSLTTVLAGKFPPPSTFARGTIDIRGSVAPGRHTLELGFDADGQLLASGDLVRGHAHPLLWVGNVLVDLGFAVVPGIAGAKHLVLFDVPADAVRLAELIQQSLPIRIALRTAAGVDIPLGTVTLTYVPE